MSADWLAALGALLSAIAASAACFAAFGQAEHARRSADIKTFTLRYAIYEAVVVAYASFVQTGKLTDEHFNALARAEREAEFLFSADAREAIQHLRFELIRYATKSNADIFYPKPGLATLETCESQYQGAINRLVPRLLPSDQPHPATEILDRLEELVLGPRRP